MDDGEVVYTPVDKRASSTGLPRHRARIEPARAGRPSALWNAHQVVQMDGPWGQFPKGFLTWLNRQLGRPRLALHVCSGGLTRGVWGYRVDIRPKVRPDVVADGRKLPFRSDVFQAVVLDPPWSVEYAEGLYGTDYPRPSHLLAEAARVCRPGGLIAFVHFLIPNPPPGAKFLRVVGLTQGCGYRIRALTLYRKEQQGLFD